MLFSILFFASQSFAGTNACDSQKEFFKIVENAAVKDCAEAVELKKEWMDSFPEFFRVCNDLNEKIESKTQITEKESKKYLDEMSEFFEPKSKEKAVAKLSGDMVAMPRIGKPVPPSSCSQELPSLLQFEGKAKSGLFQFQVRMHDIVKRSYD